MVREFHRAAPLGDPCRQRSAAVSDDAIFCRTCGTRGARRASDERPQHIECEDCCYARWCSEACRRLDAPHDCFAAPSLDLYAAGLFSYRLEVLPWDAHVRPSVGQQLRTSAALQSAGPTSSSWHLVLLTVDPGFANHAAFDSIALVDIDQEHLDQPHAYGYVCTIDGWADVGGRSRFLEELSECIADAARPRLMFDMKNVPAGTSLVAWVSDIRLADLAVDDLGMQDLLRRAMREAGQHVPAPWPRLTSTAERRIVRDRLVNRNLAGLCLGTRLSWDDLVTAPPLRASAVVRICRHCGRRGYKATDGQPTPRSFDGVPQYRRLRRCLGCDSAWFCNRDDCQRPGWTTHRRECVPLDGAEAGTALAVSGVARGA
jgi:hypothetical protein